MALILLSLLAGVLTILSPCVLPLLPIIIGGSVSDKHKWRPVIITASLATSLVVFTLALKWSTAFIDIPPRTWSIISGGLVVALGIVTLFPGLWEKLSVKLNLSGRSNILLAKSGQKQNWLGAVLVGLSLGPVFSSCSPTYALILATVLPQSFAVGLVNLIAYAVGLAAVLLLIAVFGQRIINKLQWAANPDGWFKRVLGILFIAVGIFIISGVDKKIETALVERGFGITQLEERLVQDVADDMDEKQEQNKEKEDDTEDDDTVSSKTDPNAPAMTITKPVEAEELVGLEEWINSEPLTLEELKGKVVLVDFWTYSCINCIRTLPFLTEWHDKYADDGLVILGIHAPEFAFEKVPENVRNAVEEYEIEYPVALDNEFSTWRAYNNRYWPAKYFIDREGQLRHYHFGEGEYEESEEVIRYLLAEGGDEPEDEMAELGAENEPPISGRQTPETYLGYERSEHFANTAEFTANEEVTYSYQKVGVHGWTLEGNWTVEDERVVANQDGAKLRIQFAGNNVYLVAANENGGTTMELELNGEAITADDAGADVVDGSITVETDRLYELVDSESFRLGDTLDITVGAGTELYAFTFGS